jgi:hypothetical protein
MRADKVSAMRSADGGGDEKAIWYSYERMALTRDQIATALSGGDFAIFVGEIETSSFDAKDQPYQVGADTGKREVAKDACAFANGNGGHIVIGLRTKPSPVRFADEVEEVRPVPQALVNTLQLRDIINAWIYPSIEGLDVRFFPSTADPSKGLVAIDVPAQRDEMKPFLVVRSLDGSRHVETLFGYVERKGDGNTPFGVADLQRALRAGLHFEKRLNDRFDRLEELLTSREEAPSPQLAADEALRLLDERIQSSLRGGTGGTGT